MLKQNKIRVIRVSSRVVSGVYACWNGLTCFCILICMHTPHTSVCLLLVLMSEVIQPEHPSKIEVDSQKTTPRQRFFSPEVRRPSRPLLGAKRPQLEHRRLRKRPALIAITPRRPHMASQDLPSAQRLGD